MKLQEQFVERWEGLEPVKAPDSFLSRAAPPTTGLSVAIDSGSESARERFLAADGQSPTPLEQEVMRGNNDLLDVNFLDRCTLACQAIGRIEAVSPDGRIRATGFMIAPGLLMTNQHVLENAEVAATGTIEFGYRYNVAGELSQTTRFDLDPKTFFIADERLDYAIVAAKESSLTGREQIKDFGYLRLHAESGKVREREFVTIIQHPDGQPLQIALRENQVTVIDGATPFIQYEADTAHGSSGAPVFNDSLQIAALHSGGRIKRTPTGEYVLRNGETTTSLAGLTEADVAWEANAGIRISFICADLLKKAATAFPSFVPVLQQAMSGGDILARAIVAARTATAAPTTPIDPQPDNPTETHDMQPESKPANPFTSDHTEHASDNQSNNHGIAIPLLLRISLEDPRTGAQISAPGEASRKALPSDTSLEGEAWKMQVPIIYDGLGEREGYDPNFLELAGGDTIELPELTVKGKKVAAPLLDGGFELRYHKFSVIMHKERRMALITASNVDWHDSKRKIDGKKPSRDELSGIPENVLEQWVTDERIMAGHQLPDVFYTEDRGAFDKGHLVRRDDVCWGDSFEDIQMANGDTYHVTNCTPQLSRLNQATKGDFNWGDFENEIQKKTKKERVIIFSGPVLEAKDRWFRGRDDKGPVRIQIPNRYWKIVVSKGDDGPEAFGFVFKQDVRDITEKEFAVAPEWKHAAMRIADIAKLLRGWVDLSPLEAYDQF